MKKIVFLLTLSFLSVAFAGNRTYSLSYEATKNTDELLENIIDYENTCMSGCTHYAPSVAEIKVLKHDYSEDAFYIWVNIDDVKDSQSFAEVKVTREDGKITVEQKQVSARLGNELKRISGLANNPLFKSNDVTAVLTTKENGLSQVDYKIKVTYAFYLKPLGGRIYAAIKEVSEALKARLTN